MRLASIAAIVWLAAVLLTPAAHPLVRPPSAAATVEAAEANPLARCSSCHTKPMR